MYANNIIIKMFTYLEDFKKLGTNATPYFVLTCFDELINKKGIIIIIILIRLMFDKRGYNRRKNWEIRRVIFDELNIIVIFNTTSILEVYIFI